MIRGDALEVVPGLDPFDFVVTDPPYPVSSAAAWAPEGIVESREMIDAMAQSFLGATLRLIPKNPNFAIWIFCDWKQISHYSAILNQMGIIRQASLVWDKKAIGLGKMYQKQHELILFGYRGEFTKKVSNPDVISSGRVPAMQKKHVYDKPVDLMVKMLTPFADDGVRMLDPFCGSGSALVAGRQIGWHVTGIDMSNKYCEESQQRLSQTFMM